MRQAEVIRKTKETDISIKVNLDGTGVFDIDTGVPFLDHMLEQLSKHGLFDLDIKAVGDIQIDFHHTTEDVGLALGEAFAKALGDKKGIKRFAHAYVPMDETLTRTVVDLSGRPYVVWNVEFTRDKVGEMDTELFKEWFHAFGQLLGANIHVENIYGKNSHHIIESCYKSLALALRKAVKISKRAKDQVPSTKGVI